MRNKRRLERRIKEQSKKTRWCFICMTLKTYSIDSKVKAPSNWLQAKPSGGIASRQRKKQPQHCFCRKTCHPTPKSFGVGPAPLPASARLGWQENYFLPWHSITEEFPLSVSWKLYPSKPANVPQQIQIYGISADCCLFFSFHNDLKLLFISLHYRASA